MKYAIVLLGLWLAGVANAQTITISNDVKPCLNAKQMADAFATCQCPDGFEQTVTLTLGEDGKWDDKPLNWECQRTTVSAKKQLVCEWETDHWFCPVGDELIVTFHGPLRLTPPPKPYVHSNENGNQLTVTCPTGWYVNLKHMVCSEDSMEDPRLLKR